MKRKETYLSRDFRDTAAQRFPAQAKQLNAAFDIRLNALLAENADASKKKQYHLKRQILPGIAAYETLQRVSAKPKYKEIIAKLPEFEKGDRFQLNIIGCAMLGAFVLCMPKRPDAEALTVYYENAQMTPLMKWFCRKSGKSKFTPKDIAGMKATAALKAADRNPYSWNMDFYEYPDGSGYEGRFTKCGICVLMKELGLYDLTPALCHLDYTMSEAGGVTNFVRQYTLASGGPYCDCGYKKKG